ncbi:hypothetical protein Tco_0628077 [Tanacetum coccineum]|uniref:Integrase, catalytic region, zinc finger, CCHC-type, peptidase aspartic, catalytic n=1 Tax=Tanacetum coccineum TaxID=301880 RepID=A0ABQ4WPC8_9ASTR
MVEKDEYNKLSKRFSELEQHCISLEIAMQLNKEFFQKNNTSVIQLDLICQLFELNNLKVELQEKDTTIEKLKANIKCLNKTSTTNNVKKDIDEIETINIELEHRVTKLIAENEHLKQTYKQLYDSIKPSVFMVKNNKDAHEYYLKHTMEQAAILREIVEQAKSLNPLDSASYSALSRSTKSSRSKSTNNTKNDRILHISSSTQKKNKVEDHSRIVKSSLNKSNCVVKPSGNASVQHSKLNTNSELISNSKSVMKAKIEWSMEPFRKVFTKIGYNWRPTGRTFTLVGNACPLTRITATNKVPLRELVLLKKLIYLYHIIFGALCYPNIDSENLGKLQAKADIAPVESTGSPFSTTVDQDAPSPSTSQTTPQSQSQTIPLCAEEESHDLEVAHMSNNLYFGIPILETVSEESLSPDVIPAIMHSDAPILEHLSKWTKYHSLQNIIGD